MRFASVHGGQVGHNDAGFVLGQFRHPHLKQEARTRLRDHGNHGIVGKVVARIDVRDSNRQGCAENKVFIREVQLKARHGSTVSVK